MSSIPQPLVSIVTPVYNEEQHLGECIESVLAQTYRNWEYTIVDNCSTDASLDVAKKYAAQDGRIRVHQNTKFLQAIPNFNHALRQISPASKYCKMVLADDWIFPECLERMVAAGEQYPSAGVVGAYALEGQRVALTGLPYRVTLVNGREIGRRVLLDRLYILGTQTSVLYRADLVKGRDPFYNESNQHADTEVCFELFKRSDFGFVHQVLTFTRVRPGSLYAQSLAMDTSWASTLHILVSYGPEYLTRLELDETVNNHLSGYYRFLGKSLMLRRDKAFWDYHRTQLVDAGVGYRSARVLGGAIATIVSAAVNPGSTISKLLNRPL
jgi:glycosyltransferase involved in cell wall biosynthesis